jgi:hypothetical protein
MEHKERPLAAVVAAVNSGRIIFNQQRHREQLMMIYNGEKIDNDVIRYTVGLEKLLVKLAQNSVVNIMRTHTRHGGYHGMLRDGVFICSAVDIAGYGGVNIDLNSKEAAIGVVASLLKNFPPGHYEELGFPRPKIVKGREVVQDYDPDHDVFFDVPDEAAASRCSNNKDIRSLETMKPDALKVIGPIMRPNLSWYRKIFADGLGHLHIACEAV